MNLVTGAAGFIGSHLANTLAARGEPVIGIDDLSGGWAENTSVPLIVGNLLDVDLDLIFKTHKVEKVWHLAAYAAEGLSHWVREFNVRNNWLASTRLINAAVKAEVDHFYFTSSMAVYGSQRVPYTEAMVPRPEDPYGIAKYAVEQDLKAANAVYDLQYTVFRPHNVYGPNQNLGDPYRNVVGIFMRQALQGEPLTIFGDGLQTRAFSYITDITTPMLKADGGLYNIGGETPITIRELAERVSFLAGGAEIRHVEERYEVKHAWCDHSAARVDLGFRPQVLFDEGLEWMWKWAKDTETRWSTTPEIEVERNIPAFWKES